MDFGTVTFDLVTLFCCLCKVYEKNLSERAHIHISKKQKKEKKNNESHTNE